ERALGHVDHCRGQGIGDAFPVDLRQATVAGMMAADELQPARMAAVGERDAEPARGALRSRDAGDDLDRDAGSAAGGDFLTRTPEHPPIATLEADHPPPGLGKRDPQFLDLFLTAPP